MEKVTERISKFICSTRYEEIPDQVCEVAKLHILDTLGALIAGSKEDVTGIITNYIQPLGCGQESTLITQRMRTSAQYAAFGNGVMAHVLDFDDYEVPSMAHPSVTVLPAVLALGERLRASGKQCLEAYLAGMEVISKVGRGINPEHYDKGWHSTGTLGALGAASACSKLLKLDLERVKTSLGIAASMSSGLRGNFGTMTKSFHAGHAAKNGIEAAMLASLGFTASKEILEGALGFCDIFTDGKDYDPQTIIEGLGDPFSILSPGVGLKFYPSCAATHSFLDGIFELIRQYDIKAEGVDSVECGIFYRYPKMLIHSRPRTGLEGKFSLEFCIALALTERHVSLQQFTDSKVNEPKIQELVRKVRKEVTEEAGKKGTEYPIAIIKVLMKDGKTYPCRFEKRKGSPLNPLSIDEVKAKFMDCAQINYSREQSQRVWDTVMNVEKIRDIGELIEMF
ncbi:MAG: MmgE/PrpD family protein [Thermodesulfobacteriota bacterium]